jgi:hypothetical protein
MDEKERLMKRKVFVLTLFLAAGMALGMIES